MIMSVHLSWSLRGGGYSFCVVFLSCFYETIRGWIRVHPYPIWPCVNLIEVKRSHPSSKQGHIHSQLLRVRTWACHSEDTFLPTKNDCPVGERWREAWGAPRTQMVSGFCTWLIVCQFQFMKFVLQFTYGMWCAVISVLGFKENLSCLCSEFILIYSSDLCFPKILWRSKSISVSK